MKRTRYLLLCSCSLLLVFWTGWIMGVEHYKKTIVTALATGNEAEAVRVCHAWQKSGANVATSPLYFLAIGRHMLKEGKVEAAKFNFDKAAELLGNHP